MKLSDFDYELPRELIAQAPLAERDGSRLLVSDLATGERAHSSIRELGRWLRAGDLLVLNDTKVLPGRLFARRSTGGQVEVLFLQPVTSGSTGHERGAWVALVNPARKIRPGELLTVDGAEGELALRALERAEDRGRTWIVTLETGGSAQVSVTDCLERFGRMPLPPYIERDPGNGPQAEGDRERYQTVFAQNPGAVAAPTAGLHLTHALLGELAERGVGSATVTLHVGLGTFQPIQTEEVSEHRMHVERFRILPETVARVQAVRAAGGRVVAVGTTSVRVLEGAVRDGELVPGEGETDLFLTPGSEFHVVDGLLTNFHLPRSTLLLLVSAFAGRERILDLYREAIGERYRFLSYGDAMLLLRRS